LRRPRTPRLLLAALVSTFWLAGCSAPPKAYLFGAPLPAIDDSVTAAPQPPTTPRSEPVPAPVQAALAPPAPPAPGPVSGLAPARGVWPRIAAASHIPAPDGPPDARLRNAFAAQPEAITRALARGAPYLRHIVQELDRRGLPIELVLLPVIESSYDAMAVSPAAAAGIWQLMPQTARAQGLRVDWLRDERHDPLAATEAALDFLAGLHRRLGDWHLALAAYNCGEGCVSRALARARAEGRGATFEAAAPFLPLETQAYVPRFLALRAVLRAPAAWGVALPAVDDAAPIVRVALDRDADLASIARLAGAPLALVVELNAGVQRQVLLGEHRQVWLPRGHAQRLQAAQRADASPWLQLKPVLVESDTPVADLARRHGVDVAQLRRTNAIPAALSTVRSGTVFVPLRPGEAAGALALAKLRPLQLRGEEDLAARRLALAQGAADDLPLLADDEPASRLFLPGRRKR